MRVPRSHERGADPHIEMQPILDDHAFGNALEEQWSWTVAEAYWQTVAAAARSRLSAWLVSR